MFILGVAMDIDMDMAGRRRERERIVVLLELDLQRFCERCVLILHLPRRDHRYPPQLSKEHDYTCIDVAILWYG